MGGWVGGCSSSTARCGSVSCPAGFLPSLPTPPLPQTLCLDYYCGTHEYVHSFDTKAVVAQLPHLETLTLIGWGETELAGLPPSLRTLVVRGFGFPVSDYGPMLPHPWVFRIPEACRCAPSRLQPCRQLRSCACLLHCGRQEHPGQLHCASCFAEHFRLLLPLVMCSSHACDVVAAACKSAAVHQSRSKQTCCSLLAIVGVQAGYCCRDWLPHQTLAWMGSRTGAGSQVVATLYCTLTLRSARVSSSMLPHALPATLHLVRATHFSTIIASLPPISSSCPWPQSSVDDAWQLDLPSMWRSCRELLVDAELLCLDGACDGAPLVVSQPRSLRLGGAGLLRAGRLGCMGGVRRHNGIHFTRPAPASFSAVLCCAQGMGAPLGQLDCNPAHLTLHPPLGALHAADA